MNVNNFIDFIGSSLNFIGVAYCLVWFLDVLMDWIMGDFVKTLHIPILWTIAALLFVILDYNSSYVFWMGVIWDWLALLTAAMNWFSYLTYLRNKDRIEETW